MADPYFAAPIRGRCTGSTAPAIIDCVAASDGITLYDLAYVMTYALLRGVEALESWHEDAAEAIVGNNIKNDRAGVFRCLERQLARARWIATVAIPSLIDATRYPVAGL